MNSNIRRPNRKVEEIRLLSSGYVHASGGWLWAQMPKDVWESIPSGGTIPDEYVFHPSFARLVKA